MYDGECRQLLVSVGHVNFFICVFDFVKLRRNAVE